MDYQEAIEIIVNYVEVIDDMEVKNRLSDIINQDFVLKSKDRQFLNRLFFRSDIPVNIKTAINMVLKKYNISDY